MNLQKLRNELKDDQKAFSVLTSKAFSEDRDKVTLTGIASTPRMDSHRHSLDPMGASFALPLPLLWQHSVREPVGRVVSAKASRDGITFTAEIPLVKEEGTVKTRVEEALHSLQYELVTGVSVGLQIDLSSDDSIEYDPEADLVKIKRWNWYENSLVTIPANMDAAVDAVKQRMSEHSGAVSLDAFTRATTSLGDTGQKARKPILLKES